MREITLRVTEEEYELLENFRSGRGREFHADSDNVLAVDDGGGFTFSESRYFEGGAPLIAAAFNGLFRRGVVWNQ